VWSAVDEHENHVAIEILRQRRVDSEPHERFRREVATLTELTAQMFPGVLPILDRHIPDGDAREHAWLATPVATPIRTALGDTPALGDVVAAIAAVADTLERLAERGLAHRDIKPENIYQFNGQWVIGDFDLVTTQESALTAKAAVLGPKFYIAPAMLNDPGSAVSPPATVVPRSCCESEDGEGSVHSACCPSGGFGDVGASGESEGADGEVS
jgi:serine/threonine protein kinase